MRSHVFMQASDPVVVADLQGRILDANASAAHLYGWSREELVGKPIGTIVPPDYLERERRMRERCARGEKLEFLEWERLARDGRRIPTLLTLFRIVDDDQSVLAIVSLAKDISELKRRDVMRRELLRAEERAEARERRELSRDLHDSIGQLLALARIRLAALRDRVLEDDVAERITELQALVGDAEEQARTLMFRVSPSHLDDLGLAAAVELLAETMLSRYGLEVDVHVTAPLPSLDDDARAALYRSIRELLINVSRHADTDRATVRLEHGARGLSVIVADTGRGFDPASTEEGLGLFGLRDRLEQLGGEVDIVAAPGRGTTVRLRLPDPRGG